MNSKRILFPILPILIVIVMCLSGCALSTPTPAGTPNQPFYPGCSSQNLIAHVAQANAQPGPDVIHLDPGCNYPIDSVASTTFVESRAVSNGLEEIEGDLTIYGYGAEIVVSPIGSDLGLFSIRPEVDLSLYDLTIRGAIRSVGGAVINDGGDFLASNVAFINNGAYPSADGHPALGGAIYTSGGRARVINNSIFQGNVAGETLASEIFGGNKGGAIYAVGGALVLRDTTFLENFAAGDGGAIYSMKISSLGVRDLVSISTSDFNENSAEQDGGALAVSGESVGVIMGNNSFRANQAGNYGGAVYSAVSEVTGTANEYRYNSALYGGAVYSVRWMEGDIGSYRDNYAEYISNTAQEIGGAIFSENADLYLDNSYLEMNRANSCGAVRNGGSPGLTWADGEIVGNDYKTSYSTIVDTSFVDNQALIGHGGALCHEMGEIVVRDSGFWANIAYDGGGGMIIHDKAEISGSSFTGNNAWNGGAILIGLPFFDRDESIYNYDDSIFPDYLTFYTKISTTVFAINSAEYNGGGIYAHHEGTTLITHSLFRNNTADFLGGGIHRMDGKLFINNTTISANSAKRGGGLIALSQVSSQLGIKHTTFAFNNATDVGDEDEPENLYADGGGGGLEAGYHATVDNSLFYNNSPMDCQIRNGSNYSSSNTYASDQTCGSLIEPNPDLAPLMFNGATIQTHALFPYSPLIDILPDCANMVDDQRGVPRPQGVKCEPGAYELDPDNPPEDWPFEEFYYEPEDSSDDCDPFAGMNISVVMQGVARDSTDLTLYLKVEGGIPSALLPAIQAGKVVTAKLGNTEANLCNQQGFEDRIYCMFTLPSAMFGTAQDLLLLNNDCADPLLLLPLVSIPEKQNNDDSKPGPVCTIDLGPGDCEAAGGKMSTGTTTKPRCICP